MFDILKQRFIKFNIKPDELDVWFKVKDKLPENSAQVQVYIPMTIAMCWYSKKYGFYSNSIDDLDFEKVKYWRVCKNPYGRAVKICVPDDE